MEAGAYRSSDDRFEVRGNGAGRWFLVDSGEQDELGMPRTEGPLSTLDEAKNRAGQRREQPAEASPLAARIARAARRPAADEAAKPARRGARPAPKPEPPPRTWLDRLGDRDPQRAAEARRLVAALVREGDDPAAADLVVRREVEGAEPAVAQHRLERAVERAVERASDAAALERIVRGLPASDPQAAAAALARAVAAEAVAALAGEVDRGGKAAGLPGWDLVERPSGGRGGPARGLRLRPAGE